MLQVVTVCSYVSSVTKDKLVRVYSKNLKRLNKCRGEYPFRLSLASLANKAIEFGMPEVERATNNMKGSNGKAR